jgi:hypothetical protein
MVYGLRSLPFKQRDGVRISVGHRGVDRILIVDSYPAHVDIPK